MNTCDLLIHLLFVLCFFSHQYCIYIYIYVYIYIYIYICTYCICIILVPGIIIAPSRRRRRRRHARRVSPVGAPGLCPTRSRNAYGQLFFHILCFSLYILFHIIHCCFSRRRPRPMPHPLAKRVTIFSDFSFSLYIFFCMYVCIYENARGLSMSGQHMALKIFVRGSTFAQNFTI
jgi:hypothetical protein